MVLPGLPLTVCPKKPLFLFRDGRLKIDCCGVMDVVAYNPALSVEFLQVRSTSPAQQADAPLSPFLPCPSHQLTHHGSPVLSPHSKTTSSCSASSSCQSAAPTPTRRATSPRRWRRSPGPTRKTCARSSCSSCPKRVRKRLREGFFTTLPMARTVDSFHVTLDDR